MSAARQLGRHLGQQRFLLGRALGFGVVVQAHLDRRRAHAGDLLHAPVFQQRGTAVIGFAAIAGSLDGDQQAGVARQRSGGNGLCRAVLRIEQHGRRHPGQRLHDLGLEGGHFAVAEAVGFDGFEQATQVVAMVQGQDDKHAVRCAAFLQPA